MYYIIQENVFREHNYKLLEDSLIKMDLPYTTVRVFPFVDKIVNMDDITSDTFSVDDLPEYEVSREDVFCFGALKLARIAANKKWKPGSMMNENHDFLVYKEYYKENLLNYDSKILKLTEDFSWKPDEVKFIRPTQDTKSFTGAVFSETEWKEMLENYLNNYKSVIFNENTEIQVSTTKPIQKEIRFWVVGGKIITGSQYKLGNLITSDTYFEEEAQIFAQKMVDKFQLAEAFVIDVCLTNNEWKVVECGCINCAGFYKADLQRVLVALENHFN